MVAISRLQVWKMALVSSTMVALCYHLAGLSILVATGIPYFGLIALLGSVAIARRWIDNQRQRLLVDLIEGLGLFCWVSMLGCLGSYAVAASSTGFRDATLARADAAVGFDWISAYSFVVKHHWVATIGGMAYRSIFITPLFIISALMITRRSERVWAFIMLFAVALSITLVLFFFWPARSALVFHIGVNPHYMPSTGISHISTIIRLRSGEIKVIDPARLIGLITFPSFHAVSAILYIWAGWGIRQLRLPLVIINGGMLVVTPVEGTHYLVDVIAGLLLAGLLISMLHWRYGFNRLHAKGLNTTDRIASLRFSERQSGA